MYCSGKGSSQLDYQLHEPADLDITSAERQEDTVDSEGEESEDDGEEGSTEEEEEEVIRKPVRRKKRVLDSEAVVNLLSTTVH